MHLFPLIFYIVTLFSSSLYIATLPLSPTTKVPGLAPDVKDSQWFWGAFVIAFVIIAYTLGYSAPLTYQ